MAVLGGICNGDWGGYNLKDWPQCAVDWARTEGCTARLLSEAQSQAGSDDEGDNSDESDGGDMTEGDENHDDSAED